MSDCPAQRGEDRLQDIKRKEENDRNGFEYKAKDHIQLLEDICHWLENILHDKADAIGDRGANSKNDFLKEAAWFLQKINEEQPSIIVDPAEWS